ncbi:FemAB family PEP-CTERM system-associated protein [Myxococcota bacterium]|nr:FemAB family PEP-CTERM system-associated protein [Myxococcota bacterium]
MSSPVVLRTLSKPSDPRWDAYVLAHPDGSVHHRLGWRRVIERAFGHEAHYLYAEREGVITGVLPMFAVGGPPFARALVSVPVGVTGGVLADDAPTARLLAAGARAIAERERLAYVEYKSERASLPGLPSKAGLYVTFRQALFSDRERQLAAIPRKTRAVLRESERAHLRASFEGVDALEPFLDLYALSLRNLGTPMFPRELFVASLEELRDACDLLVVRQTGRIIGAVLNYYHRDVILPFFAGALPEARDVGVNNHLYWSLLSTGWARGYRTFDFGRSKVGTGAFAFKRHFGMEEIPLEYQYDLVAVDEVPNVNPTNPKYEKVIAAWQRLPVGLTKVVGPMIQQRIP